MPEPEPTGRPREFPRTYGLLTRLLLCLILFDMIFRSFAILLPWRTWQEELDIDRHPRRLPTRAELAELHDRARAEPDTTPVRDRLYESADSFWEFLQPWPTRESRRKVKTWADTGKWAVAWACTRLDVIETIVGFNQEWPMFSPNVSRRKWVTRARLRFDDGNEREVRGLCDPEDLTSYWRWNAEKILSFELRVSDRERVGEDDDAFGYCNYLSHKYPRNEKGSPLASIRLFEVKYDFPPPGEDPRAFLAAQSGPPRESGRIRHDYYVFDAKARHGKCLPPPVKR